MSKAAIWASFLVGFFLLVVGLAFGSEAMWIIGILMLGGGLFLGLRPGGVLRQEEVLERWGILIESAQGKAEQIFQDSETFIKESQAPSIEMKRQDMAPGLMRGLWGTRRNFLVVTDRENLRMSPYQIFLNARDYGKNLDISWHLTFRPTLWQAALSLIPFVRVTPRDLSDLDLFDQQDLTAYTTVAHHSILKAVEKLKLDLNQDTSKIDRNTRGFLGIS